MPRFQRPALLSSLQTLATTARASTPRHSITTRATPHPATGSLTTTRRSSSSSSARSRPSKNMSVSTASEAEIKRNPHGDFKAVEALRPAWDRASGFRLTQTAAPGWQPGDGANDLRTPADAAARPHVAIDPYEPGRPAPFNYKLLISSIVPRPIGFVSTRSADGAEHNLAPFSYFNMVNHDPPLFVLGVAASLARPKDTLRLLAETRECVVNVISEDFLEAANATSVDAPPGADEWAVSGLTPLHDCRDVRAPRVAEAVFSVECRVESLREFESRATPGKVTGTMVVLEGTRFWVREDALNEDRNLVDPAILRPVGRLGGITYGRVTEAIEIPRPNFEKDVGGMEGYEKLKEAQEKKTNGSA